MGFMEEQDRGNNGLVELSRNGNGENCWFQIAQGAKNDNYWSRLAIGNIPVEQPDLWTQSIRDVADFAPIFMGGLVDAKTLGLGALTSLAARVKSGGFEIGGHRIGYDVPRLIGRHNFELGARNGTLDIGILRSKKWWQEGIDVNFGLSPALPGEYDTHCISNNSENDVRYKKINTLRITPRRIGKCFLFSNRVPADTTELDIYVERACCDWDTYERSLHITGFKIGIVTST